MRLQRFFLTSAISLTLASSCGKKDSSDDQANGTNGGPGGTGSAGQGQLELNFSVVNAGREAVTSLMLNDPADTRFESTSILSGPPDEMEIFVQSMTLRSNDAMTAPLAIFSEPAGKPIRISGSKIDLSSLFTNFACRTEDGEEVVLAEGETCECGLDEDGALIQKIEQAVLDTESNETGETETVCPIADVASPPVPVIAGAAGTYHTLEVTYSLGARMKGCVSGFFRETNTAATYNEWTSYCTTKTGSYFDTSSNKLAADFLVADVTAATGDWVMIPISRQGASHAGEATDQFNVNYPILGGLELGVGATAPLTFLIDTNRMLRFENGGRSDREAITGTDWTKERAFFFNGVFQDSSFLFAGKAGKIMGYQWNATNCETDAALGVNRAADDYRCDVRAGAEQRAVWKNIQGWMTIIEDPEQEPLLMSFMPDDDDALTVIKGANAPVVPGDKTPGSSFNPAAFVEKSAGVFDLRFALDASEGLIYDFPYDLAVDATSESLKYEALSSESDLTDGENFGRITFTRGL